MMKPIRQTYASGSPVTRGVETSIFRETTGRLKPLTSIMPAWIGGKKELPSQCMGDK
jgi:hypothetical protein